MMTKVVTGGNKFVKNVLSISMKVAEPGETAQTGSSR